jgi:hypothetical protein
MVIKSNEYIGDDELILKNNYYPIGLYKSDIFNYYINNKQDILREYNKEAVLIFLLNELNNTVIIRRYKGSPIYLTRKNYEFFLYKGRTISISVETPEPTDYIIIDFDYNEESVSNSDVVRYLKLIHRYLSEISIIKKIKIYSSATGFHIYGFLTKKLHKSKCIDLIKLHFNELKKDSIIVIDQVNKKRNQINLDLSSMKTLGSHTLFNCLCKNGLLYKDVSNSFSSVDKRKFVIMKQSKEIF